MSAALELINLSVMRGENTLLKGLSCSITAGKVVVILGPNGAGKSSLLLAIAGLIPAAGEIKLADTPLTSYSRHALTRQVAWQGEQPPTEFGLTVLQRLELAGAGESEETELVATDMDIMHLLDRPLGKLSSGERQRTELAALMLRDAPLWLLDEPTSHLDLKHQIHCIRMMKVESGKGRTVIAVLHDLQQALAVADQLILIDGKGGAEYGDASQFFESGTLGALFDAPLMQQGGLLIPDYGELR